MKDLNSYSKKVIELDEIGKIYKIENYDVLCKVIADLIKEEKVRKARKV